MNPQIGDKWYRYDEVQYAAMLDEYDVPLGPGKLELHLTTFTVQKVTPKGVWVGFGMMTSSRRLVLHASTKRYACATKEEAMQSFIARKNRQAAILTNQLRRVSKALELANKTNPHEVEDFG